MGEREGEGGMGKDALPSLCTLAQGPCTRVHSLGRRVRVRIRRRCSPSPPTAAEGCTYWCMFDLGPVTLPLAADVVCVARCAVDIWIYFRELLSSAASVICREYLVLDGSPRED